MQCAKFEVRLNQLLDERLLPECDTDLLAHAERCEACRELLAMSEQLFLGLEMHELPALSPDFAARVVAAANSPAVLECELVESAKAPRRQRISLSTWVSITVAASLLAALVPLLGWLRGPDEPSVAENSPKVAAPVPTVAPPPALHVAHESAPSVLAPTSPSAPADLNFPEAFATQIVLGADDLLDGRQTGEMIRNLTSRLPEVPMEDTPGLRPFATSFSLTVGMMRKTLPGGRDSTSEPRKAAQPATKPQAESSLEKPTQLS